MDIKPYSHLEARPVHSENIFHFPEGLPAFEYIKEFVFLFKPDTTPFIYMQALNPADITFVCIDPFLIHPDYKPRICDADVSFLHLKRPEDALVLSIVTVRPDVAETTANLQGPVIVNMQTSIGKQIVCENQKYPLRYKIWEALNKISTDEKACQPTRMKAMAMAMA